MAQSNIPDSEFIEAEYIGPGGNQHVMGAQRFDFDPGVPSRKMGTQYVIYYGYISGGRNTRRPVHREDFKLMIGKWREVAKVTPPPMADRLPIEPPVPLKPPAILSEVVFSLETLAGITPPIAKALKAAGITTQADVLAAGVDGLTSIPGIAPNRAKVILRALATD